MTDKISADYGTLVALVGFIAASVWLGTVAQRAVRKGSFVSSYFLGGRGLGAWALALTATVQSGGTFMGFPSYVYSHGWVVALWIAGYMVVPITGFAVLAKRLAQLSRRTKAITVPDLLRERFQSPAVGLVASLLIMFFMSFMMVAQFKAGASVMKVVWPKQGTLAVIREDAPAYVVDPSTIASLRGKGVEASVLEKLSAWEQVEFASQKELDARLNESLSADEAKAWRREIARAAQQWDWLFLFGLVLFTVIVVGYTMIGGFLAAVWTDLFQSVMMLVGVLLLLGLALTQVGSLEQATREAVANTSSEFASGPGYDPSGRAFLPPSLAFSFFFVWVFAGLGSPATLVRLMAAKDTATIRRSVFLLSAYNFCIYMPLVVICVIARAKMPSLAASDEVIPRMAILTGGKIPYVGSLLAGIILAAPFGAVMATVSSYLVVIASGVVRDLYQRFFRPLATGEEIKRVTYTVMVVVGVIAILANIRPVSFLQAIVVFSGSGSAATFVTVALMTAFWRRATAAGALAAMFAGFGMTVLLLVIGLQTSDPLIGTASAFRSYYMLGLEPIVWGLIASGTAGVVVSLLTPPPNEKHVRSLFEQQ